MIHQLLHALSAADAISNDALLLRSLLREAGQSRSEIYACSRDARAPRVRDASEFRPARNDRVILQYGNASPATDAALRLGPGAILRYHNVTPGRFIAPYAPAAAARLDRGREELTRLRGLRAMTVSDYNRNELVTLGFAEPNLVPLLVDAEGLRRSAESPAGRAVQARFPREDAGGRWVNWIFVGRVSPHKRHDDLIAAFAWYQRRVRSRSRLFVVGGWQSLPAYKTELEYVVARHGVRNVVFAGQPALADGFGGYYAAADVFVCASEHEGFCLPVVEAMAFGLPIVARARAGVPCSVGMGGLLVTRDEPEALAEGVRLLLEDGVAHAQFAAWQPRIVAAHSRSAVAEALTDALRAFGALA